LTATSGVVTSATHSNPGFLSVGDWGSAALGGYHLRNAMATAAAMKAVQGSSSSSSSIAFVINTGDNFYYCGIQNTSDPQISSDYTALFGGMGIPWYNSLGNHDYGFSPEAQLSLNETIPGWIMDARYYHRRVVVPRGDAIDDEGIVVNIIVLDTSPCIKEYRGTDRRKWDPCGSQYPDCSPIAEPCRFNENILSQDCDTQLTWARQTLDNITSRPGSAREWVFVVGHNKAEEINIADFQTTFLDDPRVHLYLNGHTHNLEHYEINGKAKYMTTGAGGMVFIGDNESKSIVSLIGNSTPQTKYNVKSIWKEVVTGFTRHTFMNNGTVLETVFLDTKRPNTPLHQFRVYLEVH
jgi:tartrate-resistant acid phosphatase type 5